MLFFDENNKTLMISDLRDPILSDFHWILDLPEMDFALAPIQMLEEITCPAVGIQINGFIFYVPTFWNMLIADPETSELDIVEVGEMGGRNFFAVTHGPLENRIKMEPVKVVDYVPQFKHTVISSNKLQMLCHPISKHRWVCLSPSDSYNKHIKNTSIGDLI